MQWTAQWFENRWLFCIEFYTLTFVSHAYEWGWLELLEKYRNVLFYFVYLTEIFHKMVFKTVPMLRHWPVGENFTRCNSSRYIIVSVYNETYYLYSQDSVDEVHSCVSGLKIISSQSSQSFGLMISMFLLWHRFLRIFAWCAGIRTILGRFSFWSSWSTSLTDLSSLDQPRREKGSWQKLILLSGYCSMVQKKPQTP